MPELSPLIVIVGETASGKSALALQLAELFDGELICADSWTVYKDFDIGTAKPSLRELEQIPHHLLDIADPALGFSAVEFQKQAREVIGTIVQRGKLPVMVGGTGLYIDSVLYEYQFLPAPPEGLREALNLLSLEALIQKAVTEGLDTTGIDLRNKRRVIRLIENNGQRPSKSELRQNTLIIGIETKREQLRDRVTSRVEAMMTAGLEDEVRRLSKRYGWEAEPMKGIGYREWQPFMQGEQSYEQTRERIISATMNLAKRQRTWFKRNPHIQWVSGPEVYQQAVDLITSFLAEK